MSSHPLSEVVFNIDDISDATRPSKLESIAFKKSYSFQEYETDEIISLDLYVCEGKYEDCLESFDFLVGQDGYDNNFGCLSTQEWLDYVEETFGRKVEY